jgi:hypothetical protein
MWLVYESSFTDANTPLYLYFLSYCHPILKESPFGHMSKPTPAMFELGQEWSHENRQYHK